MLTRRKRKRLGHYHHHPSDIWHRDRNYLSDIFRLLDLASHRRGWKIMTSFLPICIVITIGLLISSFTITANATHHQYHHKSTYTCKPPYTTLYVYTFPETKECVLLMHNGKVVQAQAQTQIPRNSSNSTDGGRCIDNTCQVQDQNRSTG